MCVGCGCRSGKEEETKKKVSLNSELHNEQGLTRRRQVGLGVVTDVDNDTNAVGGFHRHMPGC